MAAPAGPVDPSACSAGVAVLRGWGLEVEQHPGLLTRTGFLAGDDARRREELRRCIVDTAAAGLWFARGGYGTMRTLEGGLDLSPLAARPRVLVGFSDLTPLLNRVAFDHGLIAIHGPTLTSLGELCGEAREHLQALLFEPQPEVTLQGREALVPGAARGRLCGGNLAMLAHTLGTPLEVHTRDRILLIEEVGETPYRLDRLLTQLRMAGLLDRAAGVVVGHLSSSADDEDALLDVARERLGGLAVPVLLGLPVGHREDNRALPLGARVAVDTDALRLVVEEGAVR